MIEEELGAITAPVRYLAPQWRRPHGSLPRHPMMGDQVQRCDLCGRRGLGYEHPNPLRPGVVLWRCRHHRHPKHVVDNPKAAPGGGVYR